MFLVEGGLYEAEYTNQSQYSSNSKTGEGNNNLTVKQRTMKPLVGTVADNQRTARRKGGDGGKRSTHADTDQEHRDRYAGGLAQRNGNGSQHGEHDSEGTGEATEETGED